MPSSLLPVTLPAFICEEPVLENVQKKVKSADGTLRLMVLENNHVVMFTLNINITYMLFVAVNCGGWNDQCCVAAVSLFTVCNMCINQLDAQILVIVFIFLYFSLGVLHVSDF